MKNAFLLKKKNHPSLNNIKKTKQFTCLIPSQRRCLVRHNSIKLFFKLPERKSQEYLFTLYLIYRIKIALKTTGPTGLFLLILLKTILNPEKSGFRNNILKFLWLVNHQPEIFFFIYKAMKFFYEPANKRLLMNHSSHNYNYMKRNLGINFHIWF